VLQRLELEKDASARQRIERRAAEERSPARMSGYAAGRAAHILERRQAASGVNRH
jgi:hypothetical protein